MEKLDRIIAKAGALKAPKHVDAPPMTQAEWEATVGSRIAARARPVRLHRGVLQVRAATAAWANELSLLADVIVERLQAAGLEAHGLRFSVGPLEGSSEGSLPSPPARPAALPDAPLPPLVRERVERVQDPALQQALGRAAAGSLALQSEKPRESK